MYILISWHLGNTDQVWNGKSNVQAKKDCKWLTVSDDHPMHHNQGTIIETQHSG